MKHWPRLFLYAACIIPDAIFGWPVVLLCRLFWGEALAWEDGTLRCRARADSWLQRKFGGRWGAVTLSPHARVYLQGRLYPEELTERARIQIHEGHHGEQGQAAQLSSTLEALVLLPVLLLLSDVLLLAVLLPVLVSGTGHLRKSAAAYVTAWLRGEPGKEGYPGWYLGAHIEKAARAVAGQDRFK